MSKLKFTISFKQTKRERKIYDAIQDIEEQERSQKIKEILEKALVLNKGEGKNE